MGAFLMRALCETGWIARGQGVQPFVIPHYSPKFCFAFLAFRATLSRGQVVVPETKTGRRAFGMRRTDRRSLCRRKYLSLSLSLHSRQLARRSLSQWPNPCRSSRPSPANTNKPDAGVRRDRQTCLSADSRGRVLALAPVVCLMQPVIQEGIRC